MVKKIILNDNEVVFNEDVSDAQDWRSQDLNSALEAMFNGSFRGGPSSVGTVFAGSILSGLLIGTSLTNLNITVSSGLGIFAFGGGDTSRNNRYRLASVDGDTTLTLPVAHTTLHRWDLIEVSAEEVTATETRQVLTNIGPTRTLVPTVVPKTVSSNLKLRIRSGVPDSLANARLPTLQPDQAWLPVAAIRVTPSAVISAGFQVLDLRKMFEFCSPPRPTNTNKDGFRSAVSMSSNGQMVTATANWVHMGQYCSPLGTTPQQASLGRPQINVNVDKPASLVLQVNRWYYIYAYRPNLNCGFSAMVLTSVPPDATDNHTRGKPSAALDLPVPWPVSDPNAVAMYMGAVRLYDNGGTFFPLPFRKAGGYTALAYTSEAGYAGAATQGKIHPAGGALIAPSTTQTDTINPDGDGFEAVPPHSRLVKVNFQFENISTSVSSLGFAVRANLTPPFVLYGVTEIDPDHMVTTGLDVPVDSTFSISIICSGSTPTDVGAWRGWVQGYYEEMP